MTMHKQSMPPKSAVPARVSLGDFIADLLQRSKQCNEAKVGGDFRWKKQDFKVVTKGEGTPLCSAAMSDLSLSESYDGTLVIHVRYKYGFHMMELARDVIAALDDAIKLSKSQELARA